MWDFSLNQSLELFEKRLLDLLNKEVIYDDTLPFRAVKINRSQCKYLYLTAATNADLTKKGIVRRVLGDLL